jgi:UDP-GlcNAc:undecaprenyl-phosphate GlcNAc-1-phosphate transferase
LPLLNNDEDFIVIEGQMILTVLILSVSALIINLIYTRIIITISHKRGWFDQKESRKLHTEDTPRLGGIGLFTSLVIVSVVAYIILPSLEYFAKVQLDTIFVQLLLLFLGFGLVHYIGLIDDFKDIRAIYKLFGQILSGILVVLGGGLISTINIPFINSEIDLGALSGAITIIWLISISNAINLIDGMDGLAGGTSTVAALSIGIIHLITGNTVGAILSFTLFGALIGFLFFNLPKAKIFMGDSGSLFLGFVLASLIFIHDGTPNEMWQLVSRNGFYLTIIILLVPIIDTLGAIIRRIREKKPVHHPDKEHIHHKLLNLGFSVKKTLVIIMIQNILLSAAVILWIFEESQHGGSTVGTIMMIVSVLVVLGFFYWLHYAHRARKRATQKNQ